MLFVVFWVGANRYALDVRRIEEVLPLVTVQPVPGAPDGVAGVCLYRGTPVPVVDISLTVTGSPSRSCASTRLIVLNVTRHDDQVRHLGLIAENATGTVRLEPSAFAAPVVTSAVHPALGAVAVDAAGMIQQVTPELLLSPEASRALYQEAVC
jgi:chemotaxis-related protein WspB